METTAPARCVPEVWQEKVMTAVRRGVRSFDHNTPISSTGTSFNRVCRPMSILIRAAGSMIEYQRKSGRPQSTAPPLCVFRFVAHQNGCHTRTGFTQFTSPSCIAVPSSGLRYSVVPIAPSPTCTQSAIIRSHSIHDARLPHSVEILQFV